MRKSVKTILTFVAGAIVGGFVTKKYMEYKSSMDVEEVDYEDCEDVDYEDVDYDVDNDDMTSDEEAVDKIMRDAEEERERYDQLLQNLKYKSQASNQEPNYEPEPVLDPPVYADGPYLITQEEFEVLDDYESDEYIYYADRYITDSYGMPVSEEDIENCFGPHVEDYLLSGADQIWIRNERMKMDFSIIRDLDNFVDVAPARIKRMVGLI